MSFWSLEKLPPPPWQDARASGTVGEQMKAMPSYSWLREEVLHGALLQGQKQLGRTGHRTAGYVLPSFSQKSLDSPCNPWQLTALGVCGIPSSEASLSLPSSWGSGIFAASEIPYTTGEAPIHLGVAQWGGEVLRHDGLGWAFPSLPREAGPDWRPACFCSSGHAVLCL